MNLASMAERICRKVGKTDPDSVAECKGFLRSRHELCYDRTLWKDTLEVRTVDVPPGATFVVLPFQIARPLVVWDDLAGIPMDVTSLFAAALVNPASLRESGWSMRFCEADSVGWPYDLTAGSGGASALSFIATGQAAVDVNIYGEFLFEASALTPTPVTMSETVTVPVGSPALSRRWVSISRLTKAQTDQPLVVGQTSPIPEQTWVWPADVETVEFARLRLISPQDRAFRLGVLGKKRFRQMRLDQDPPMIRGIDNALLALGEADMLERSRQYAKAASKTEEGLSLIQLAIDQEKNQSAYEARIIPQVSDVEGGDADLYD